MHTDLWFGNSHGFLKPAVQKAPLQVSPSLALQLQIELLHTSKLEYCLCLLSLGFVDQVISLGTAGNTAVRLLKSLLYQRETMKRKDFCSECAGTACSTLHRACDTASVLFPLDHEAALQAGQQAHAVAVLLGHLHGIQRRQKEVYLWGLTIVKIGVRHA